MMFRWGIIGCGAIAPKFFRSMEKTGEGRVVAAASCSQARANRFQRRTGVERVYTSYEEMLDRESLDAVYIATSHNFHVQNAKLCLDHGLPVLVEKAFTRNAEEAAEVIEMARERELFCMEAMWTRCNPVIVRLKQLLDEGAIGEVEHLAASFCVRMNPWSPKLAFWNRVYNPRLAGGALLDLGVYAVSFARMVFGRQPRRITSSVRMAWTGVDWLSECALEYPGGKRADLVSSFRENRSREAVLHGTNGIIRIPDFMHPDHMVVVRSGHAPETVRIEPERLDDGATGFQHEIREFHRCLNEGLKESPRMPLGETLDVMHTLDALRAQWGMKYPGE